MFATKNDSGYQQVLPGIRMKTLVYGEKSLLVEFHLALGAELPLHSHPHEQSGYLVSGVMELNVAGEVRRLTPGDAWCIPGGLEHSARIVEDAIAVEVFAPRRDEYLPSMP